MNFPTERRVLMTAAALLLGACAASSDTGQTERPTPPPPDCDRTCVEDYTDHFSDALVAERRAGSRQRSGQTSASHEVH